MGAVVIACWLVVLSCATIKDLAPPLDAPTLQLAASQGLAPERPSRGRELYITTCARCHRPEPVVRYGVEQWQKILPRMFARSKLGADEAEAVEAYVMLTLQAADLERAGEP